MEYRFTFFKPVIGEELSGLKELKVIARAFVQFAVSLYYGCCQEKWGASNDFGTNGRLLDHSLQMISISDVPSF